MDVIAWVLFAPLSIALVVIDLRTHRLPNNLVSASFVIGAFSFRDGFIESAILFLAYLLLHQISRGGIGMGDVKLAAVIGLYAAQISLEAVVVATWLAFVLGGLIALAGFAMRRLSKQSHIAFGPFMLAGLWLTPLVLSR